MSFKCMFGLCKQARLGYRFKSFNPFLKTLDYSHGHVNNNGNFSETQVALILKL